ncbi:MAG: UbiA family prenyltransferase [Bacteroidetes bacterium]|nr:UbiA family prenyltransferase [Bacteroidota bacterium]
MTAVFIFLVYNKTARNVSTNVDLTVLLYGLGVVLIMFGGYIINDYYDQKIDEENRPGNNLFTIPFFKKWGIVSYVVISALGIGINFQRPFLTVFMAIVASSLFFYAKWAKGWPFIGNFIVALCTAATIYPLATIIGSWSIISVYMAFAFLMSMAREMSKDVEDIDGDKKYGLKTAAILLPRNVVKANILTFLFITLLGLSYLAYHIAFLDDLNLSSTTIYYLLFLMIPIVIRSMNMVIRANEKEEWHKLSNWLKMIMLAGVISLAII